VCASRRELNTHALRLLAAQVISVTFFIVAPLKCIAVRPETTGLYGMMLDALLAFDKPFNQAPALHISLLVILWVCYARHLRGAWRGLLHVWFLLIGISVLTTYQHHFFDIPTGIWTGLFCLWLFPDHGNSPLTRASFTKEPRRRQLALRYGGGALAIAATAIAVGGWALWLLWATGSLLLVALIYAALDATAFQKDANGRMSLAALTLLAPYLACAWLNSRWWTRHAPTPSAVTQEVWIGRLPSQSRDVPAGVNAQLDLCAELPRAVPANRYQHLPALDLVPLTEPELRLAAQAITRLLGAGPVLVVCALGYSRSAAAVAAWLITSGQAKTVEEAIAQLQRARRNVVVSQAQRLALGQLAHGIAP
jgi:protein-tyrosine phosphatase